MVLSVREESNVVFKTTSTVRAETQVQDSCTSTRVLLNNTSPTGCNSYNLNPYNPHG
jgi:hypothetical protein